MSPKYENTIVYKLKCLDPLVPDFYLGYSTFSLVHVSKMFESVANMITSGLFANSCGNTGVLKTGFSSD